MINIITLKTTLSPKTENYTSLFFHILTWSKQQQQQQQKCLHHGHHYYYLQKVCNIESDVSKKISQHLPEDLPKHEDGLVDTGLC